VTYLGIMKKHLKTMVLGILAIMFSQHISAQGLLGIGASSLTGLPDTARYGDTLRNINVWVVNRSVIPLTGILVQIMASPNQDTPFQLGLLDLTQGLLIAPGDSVQVPMDDYTVSPQNSNGGSNVIVIWPTAPGTQPDDSAGGTYWVEESLAAADLASATSLLPYPNPGSGVFRLKHTQESLEGGTVRLYQSSGQLVAMRSLDASGLLDFTDMPEGLYAYRIELKGLQADSGKLLIQRN
jgi:hypothetical protein